jgi:hypothetical protein
MQKNASGFAENLLKPYQDNMKQAPLSRYLIISMQEQLLKIHLVFLPQFGVFQKHIGLHPKLDIVKKKVVC